MHTLKTLLFSLFAGLFAIPAFNNELLNHMHAGEKYYFELFSKIDKKALFNSLANEALRIDGDALWCRRNRPVTWQDTVDTLEKEINQKTSPLEFGRILQRLDATYPSLHAKIQLAEELDYRSKAKKRHIPITFSAIVRAQDASETSIVIDKVDPSFFHKTPRELPKAGDEVTAINDKPINEWRDENFIFCKFALKAQCDSELWENFRSGLLNFDLLNSSTLTYSLKRQEKLWKITVPILDKSKEKKETDSEFSCEKIKDDYPGFTLVFAKGQNACLFEKNGHRDTALLRIASFTPKVYKGKNFGPQQEADLLLPYWQKHATRYKQLLIDLSGNLGGDIPSPLTALIVNVPFQDQWVQFKKTIEFESPAFRSNLFSNGRLVEKSFHDLNLWKNWHSLKYGEFTPPIPQFCVEGGTNCLTDNFLPAAHGFNGNVILIVDQWCVSSCSGFAWTLKNYLPEERIKLVGFPDSADTTFERYRINIWLDPLKQNGFELSVQPRKHYPDRHNSLFVLSWQVSATRSTDKKGSIISMMPLPVDRFITWYSDHKKWIKDVLKHIKI